MSDETSDLVKVVGGAGGGGLVLWLVQRLVGKAFDRSDDAEKKQAAEMEALRTTVHGLVTLESERKAQREELARLGTATQDVSNKLSILLDRDSQRQRRDESVDAHLRDIDGRLAALERDVAGLKVSVSEGTR